jgi:lipoic acid synthetase
MVNHNGRKPDWLRKKMTLGSLREMQVLLGEGRLHTVCEEAMCPNIGECFSKKQATFLILGKHCTRACSFCAVTKGAPLPPDPGEPARVADAAARMGLRHVVITSPTRDDLADGGAAQFAATVQALRAKLPDARVELLIPDFREFDLALATVAQSGAAIIGHNIETVPRLYHVRKGADYARSLRVLHKLAGLNSRIRTKSALMLGLGETEAEVLAVMADLLASGCGLLSIGQYLSPGPAYEAVAEYVKPERFDYFRQKGLEMGFAHIQSSPYTRSSYLAEGYLEWENPKRYFV